MFVSSVEIIQRTHEYYNKQDQYNGSYDEHNRRCGFFHWLNSCKIYNTINLTTENKHSGLEANNQIKCI